MGIDVAKAKGFELPPIHFAWNPDTVILYHLGLGAGDPPTDPNELGYAYEGRLKVLPTFGVVTVYDAAASMINVPGLEFNPALALHGEHELIVDRPLPTHAEVVSRARIAEIFDKRKAALVILEAETFDSSGQRLFVNRFSVFLRGAGGFGGPGGPPAANEPRSTPPDAVVESKTLPQQALLFRLSGDKNPLHADPEFAKLGGFDRPILHGLCSYGVICKGVVDHLLGGDVTKVRRFQARFRGVVFPGETLVTSIWRDGHRLIIQSKTKERDSAVLSNAVIETE